MKVSLGFLFLIVGTTLAQDNLSYTRSRGEQELAKLWEEEQAAKGKRLRGLNSAAPAWADHHKEYIDKFVRHAEMFPSDTSAVRALIEAISLSGALIEREPEQDLLARFRRQYLKTDLVVPALRDLGMNQAPFMTNILREIGETHPSKRVRALAWRALITGRTFYLKGYLPLLASGKRQPPSVQESVDRWTEEIAEARKKLAAADLVGALPDISVGSKAPATSAVDLTGKKLSLKDYQGKVIVLEFWFTQCGPCIKKIPATNALIEELKDRPFVVICASTDESAALVSRFQQTTKLLAEQWWIGPESAPLEIWDVESSPTTIILDHEGIIRHRQVGYDPKTDKTAAIVRELVKKAERAR